MSGREDIHTPWNRQTLPERCATVKQVCQQEPSADAEGQGGAVHELRHEEGSQSCLPSDRAENKPGATAVIAGAPNSPRAAREAEGSNPSPATNPLRVGGLTVDPEDLGRVAISEAALFALKLIAAHENCSLGRAVEIAAYHYGTEGIGLPGLTDAYQGSAR